MTNSQFTFPFSTCETPSTEGFVAQPVSASINLVTVVILIVATFYAKTSPVQVMLISYALFEAWHTFSHIRHVPGMIQTNVAHVISYAISFSTLYAILYLSKTRISNVLALLITLAVMIDIWVWIKVKGAYTIYSGLFIFLLIVVGSVGALPLHFRNMLPILLGFLFILVSFIWNEAYNCERMMQYKQLPYHAAIELVGLILFSLLAYLFLHWESMIRTSSSI